MRLCVLCAVALSACGSVKDQRPVPDAPPQMSDAPAIPDGAEIPDALAACTNAAPRCTDNSCSRLTWAFDSNMLDGAQALTPPGQAIAVRNHAGNLALAIDVVELSEVSFRVPVCASGSIQLQTKMLLATVFFDGGMDPGNQYYVQASVPAPMTGAFLLTKDLPSGSYVTYSAPISASQFANTATDIVFKAGTFGAHFTGTIWFDDIRIQ